MSAVIKDRVKVAPGGTVTIVDDRLHPGEEVEVVVRTIDRPASKFLSAARDIRIDAPPDYSISFEDGPMSLR